VNPRLKIFEVSSLDGTGMNEWVEFLKTLVDERKTKRR